MNSVIVRKESQGIWVLRIATSIGTDQELVNRYTFKTLIQALQAASILKLRVDNDDLLPVSQYRKYR